MKIKRIEKKIQKNNLFFYLVLFIKYTDGITIQLPIITIKVGISPKIKKVWIIPNIGNRA